MIGFVALALFGMSLVLAPRATAAQSDLLLPELGCPACHVDLDARTDIREKAPPLDDAGLRYRPEYLFTYLRDPGPVRRHIGRAQMPKFPLSDDEALALVAFLSEQKRLPDSLPEIPPDLDAPVAPDDRIRSEAELERVLGDELDCLTCHRETRTTGLRGPVLTNAGARLQPEWMRRFLLAPSAWGLPDGVMPGLFVRPGDDGVLRPVDDDAIDRLRRIVDSLERSGEPQLEQWRQNLGRGGTSLAEADPAVGRRIFDALACAACHPFRDAAAVEPAPDLRDEAARVYPTWLRTYLTHPWPVRPFGPRPGSGGRMPTFRLDPAEVEQIAAELGIPEEIAPEPESQLTAFESAKALRVLRHELPCLGCHRFEDDGGRVGPDLRNAASRLRPSFVRAMIENPEATVAHVTMPKVPLDDETSRLIEGLLTEPREAEETAYLSLVGNDTIPLPAEPGAARDYARLCAPCHGTAGDGDGFNAPFLPVRPTLHSDATEMSTRANDTLYDGIAAGGAVLDRHHYMPAWRDTLSPARIEALVEYIRQLCDCDPPAWSTGARTAEPRTLPRHRRTALPRMLSAHDTVTFDEFLGAQACAECHAREYEVWSASTHGHAGGAPDEHEVIAAFDGVPRKLRDGTFRPVVREDGSYVFEVRQKGQPDVDVEVAAVIGGGHMIGGGTQAFFAEMVDGTFRMLPFDFSKGLDTWFVQRRGDNHWTPIGPDIGFADLTHWGPFRALGAMPRLSHCENCHGSQILVTYDEGTKTYETRWKTLRVDCEACHGPGRDHVAWARADGGETNPDPAIDTLDVLDKYESLEVCFRCHANKQVLTAEYLPGMDPLPHFAFKHPMFAQGAYLDDGRINGFGYQQNHIFSDCFVEGSMVCTDCHDPHSQTYRDVTGLPLEGRFDDGQCTGCHASKALDVSAHTHHLADSAGSRCVSCHMPFLQHQMVGDVVPFARSDHTIPIPRPAFDESLGIENACAKCHPDRSTAALQADVEKWWGPLKPHHPMIQRILVAREETDPATAAALLLAPMEPHGAAQMAGLSAFVRGFVRTDAPLDPDAIDQLVALTGSDDPDIRAIALTALDVASPRAAGVAKILTTARAEGSTRAEAIRARWRYALVDLSRLRRREGDPEEADRVRAKARGVPKRVQ